MSHKKHHMTAQVQQGEEQTPETQSTETQAASEQVETLDTPETSEQPEQPETPEQTIIRLEAEIADLKDKNLRQLAEFDNYRKRTIKEKTELILNGSQTAVKAILPVIDDLERSLASMEKAEDVAAVAEGVQLIYQKLMKTLEGMGVKQIETQDADFNTDFHEAIAQVPGVPDEQKGRVIDCVEKGYMLNEKVIRHAKVAVGM